MNDEYSVESVKRLRFKQLLVLVIIIRLIRELDNLSDQCDTIYNGYNKNTLGGK